LQGVSSNAFDISSGTHDGNLRRQVRERTGDEEIGLGMTDLQRRSLSSFLNKKPSVREGIEVNSIDDLTRGSKGTKSNGFS
jgi:hypothetical protein